MSSFASRRRALAAALVPALAVVTTWGRVGSARAADSPPRTYVVLSLIGDRVSVVKRRIQTGTRVANEQLEIPVADATFDRIAMIAAEAAIQRAQPGANVLQASIRDTRLFALQDGLLTETSESRDLRAALQGLLAKYGATHLLIVTKRRSPASFKLVDSTVGDGMINGIGFYVDNITPIRYVGSNEDSAGFLCPFAYLSVTLLDAGSLRTLKSGTALESKLSLTVDTKDAVRAWDALTAEQKVDALEAVIKSGVAKAAAAAMAE